MPGWTLGARLIAVRVSPLALGGMSLGDQWGGFFGQRMDQAKCFELLDHY